jgi:hypothetical protein
MGGIFWDFLSSPLMPQWALVPVTAIAAVYAYRAFTQARRQADAADAMIRLTHRPRIIVRNVVIENIEKLNRSTSDRNLLDIDFSDFKGHYTLANIGGTVAKQVHISHGIYVGTALPMERPATQTIKPVPALQPGVAQSIALPAIALSPGNGVAVKNEKADIYWLSLIKYADELGNVRETSICRRFDRQAKRFVRVEDSDYEYAD